MGQGSDLFPVVCLLVRRATPKKSREPTLRFAAQALPDWLEAIGRNRSMQSGRSRGTLNRIPLKQP
jgi:hypothetical protein